MIQADFLKLDEVLLKDGMTENYGSISNEYYDNSKNEKKIDLRIV